MSRVSFSLRSLLLGVTLLMVALGGCGEQSEPESSRQSSALRKKIGVAKEAPSEATKPREGQPETVPTPESQGGPVPEAAMEAKKLEPKTSETEAVTEAPLPSTQEEPPAGEETALTPPDESGEPALAKRIWEKNTYSYHPAGKLDPFKPLFEIEAERRAEAKQKVRKERKVPITPLQKIDLSQLKLTGVILSPTQNKAMVQEPTGKAYIIIEGTYIGQNFGQVKKILLDRVIVEEELEDLVTGEVTLQTTELRLQKRVGD